MIRYCFPFAIVITLLICVQDSQAQRVPRYNQRPVLSPYVNLFNNNQGGVNNYFTFVRPMQRQLNFNQQQLQLNQQQVVENQYLEQQITQPTMAPGGFQAGMLRPGSMGTGQQATAASYFNYSHFYKFPAVLRRR